MSRLSRADRLRYLRNRYPDPDAGFRNHTTTEEEHWRNVRQWLGEVDLPGFVQALKRKYRFPGRVPDMTLPEGLRPTWEEYEAILAFLWEGP